ncbi:hypothetical protein [Anaerocaecibacter muris]|uniref:hypothetical protein n=1 Tax=Anaerocaecibacter muris TaxID=2941513 RepID=UPI00203A50F4|nr:hypothetical protein [Anaerocaecibacter muris]MCX4312833.1 hypothetical protein [Clostridia bacterium]
MSVQITHGDCLKIMPTMADNSVDFTLTDIPYGEVNRSDNGLRKLTKEQADILTFGLTDFLSEVYRITKNNICIFCGREQFSEIHKFFTSIGGGELPTYRLGEIKSLPYERAVRLFKRRGIRRMVQKARLESV